MEIGEKDEMYYELIEEINVEEDEEEMIYEEKDKNNRE